MSKHSIIIQWSDEDEAYVATTPELPDLSALGPSPEEAAKELAIAKEAYLEVLKEDGEEIPKPDVLKPFSGQTRLRLPKSLHASLSNQAQKEGVSLNTYIVTLLVERNTLSKISNRVASMEKILYTMFLSESPSLQPTAPEGLRFIVSSEATDEKPLGELQ